MEELVSVIIPVYNRQETISRAIDSVLGQTYTNIEVIVVDDGSCDDTMEILRHYSDTRIRIFSQNHKGACAARNKGIDEAKGIYIAFQDSDDEWMPDKLYKQISYMQENCFKVCYCPFMLYDIGVKILPKNYLLKDQYEEYIKDTLKSGNVISTQTLIMEKDVLDKVGKFDEEMPRLQDYELVIRIVQQYNIGYCAEVLVKVYRQEISISHNDRAYKDAVYYLIKKHKNFFSYEYIRDLFYSIIDILEKDDIDYLIELQKIAGIMPEEYSKILIDFLYKKYFPFYSLLKYMQKYQYNEFEKKLQTDSFVIYGAGNYAKRVLDILLKKNLRPKFFWVSSPLDAGQYIQEIPVDNPNVMYKDIPVLIAVGMQKQEDIMRYLAKEGFVNYCSYPVFELNFT